jgi:transcriptional regulator with XRE-family HTH domain
MEEKMDWNRKPFKLFDYLLDTYQLRTDRELARELGVQSGYISRVRHGHAEVTANFILAVHDAFGMEIREIKALAQTTDGQS